MRFAPSSPSDLPHEAAPSSLAVRMSRHVQNCVRRFALDVKIAIFGPQNIQELVILLRRRNGTLKSYLKEMSEEGRAVLLSADTLTPPVDNSMWKELDHANALFAPYVFHTIFSQILSALHGYVANLRLEQSVRVRTLFARFCIDFPTCSRADLPAMLDQLCGELERLVR